MNKLLSIIEKLKDTHKLTLSEYEYLIENRNGKAVGEIVPLTL